MKTVVHLLGALFAAGAVIVGVLLFWNRQPVKGYDDDDIHGGSV